MEIKLRRIDDNFLMEAVNEDGNTTLTDGSPAIGGGNQAMRPMQLLLVGMGGCSSIDIIHLLRKQRQELDDIRITVTGDRVQEDDASRFEKIKIHFELHGDIKENKAERAVRLSMEKYCSVALILQKSAKIEWSYSIVNKNAPISE